MLHAALSMLSMGLATLSMLLVGFAALSMMFFVLHAALSTSLSATTR